MQQFMTLDNSSLEKIAVAKTVVYGQSLASVLDSLREACLLVVCLYLRGVL